MQNIHPALPRVYLFDTRGQYCSTIPKNSTEIVFNADFFLNLATGVFTVRIFKGEQLVNPAAK